MASQKPFSEVVAALHGKFGFGSFEYEPDLSSIWGRATGEGIELKIQAQVTSSAIVGSQAPADSLVCAYGITLLTEDEVEFEFRRFESLVREIFEAVDEAQ